MKHHTGREHVIVFGAGIELHALAFIELPRGVIAGDDPELEALRTGFGSGGKRLLEQPTAEAVAAELGRNVEIGDLPCAWLGGVLVGPAVRAKSEQSVRVLQHHHRQFSAGNSRCPVRSSLNRVEQGKKAGGQFIAISSAPARDVQRRNADGVCNACLPNISHFTGGRAECVV